MNDSLKSLIRISVDPGCTATSLITLFDSGPSAGSEVISCGTSPAETWHEVWPGDFFMVSDAGRNENLFLQLRLRPYCCCPPSQRLEFGTTSSDSTGFNNPKQKGCFTCVPRLLNRCQKWLAAIIIALTCAPSGFVKTNSEDHGHTAGNAKRWKIHKGPPPRLRAWGLSGVPSGGGGQPGELTPSRTGVDAP